MYYVYIIRSENYPEQIYVGITANLKKRLVNHNAGSTVHTAKYRPWKLKVFVAFSDQEKALSFEMYLKSGSGRAFCAKRLI